MKAWALVPARGGSKSIPYKNLAPLAGRPLLDYGVRAAQAAACFERIICSTDDERIAEHAASLGIEVDRREASLALDDTPVVSVAKEFLHRSAAGGQGGPDVLVLVQPTSPFLLPQHVRDLLDAMEADPAALSGQTITPVVHNHHAWNQRVAEGGRVRFAFADERSRAYNKQAKPKFHVFGNLVAARPVGLDSPLGFFSDPSVAVEIEREYAFDVDDAHDLRLAGAMIATQLVRLAHLGEGGA